MSKEIYISSTPHETRLAIVEDDNLAEIYYERENEYTLAGSIYNGRVTRVLPGMQSAFVEIGLERDAFLYITDFMEEAGDSADFETTHGDGEARRERSENQRRERSESRSEPRSEQRPERGERSAPLTLEGSAASDRGDEGRIDRAELGDRNGRGRNRRGRGERVPVGQDGGDEREASSLSATVEEEALPATLPPTVGKIGEVGEGAPGADGSRRWRGRRGRRRRRSGGGQPEDAAREANAPVAPLESEAQPFEEEPIETDEAPELLGSSLAAEIAEVGPVNEVQPPTASYQVPGHRQPREGRGQRSGGNDRVDRSSDARDRRDRGLRVPRGFAPSHNLYGVEAQPVEGEESENPVEPIILPGESLSKYRRGSQAETVESAIPAPVPAGIVLAKPRTIVDDSFVAKEWDGGAVLPGESLSRRNRSEQRREPRAEQRANVQNAPPRNFQAPEQVEAPQVLADAEGVSVAAIPEEQPEVAQVAHLDQVPAEEVLHETASPFTHQVPAELDAIAAAPEPVAAPEAEYEPMEASASYRVDPVAPSEFRQSGSVLEEEPVEQSPSQSEATEAEAVRDASPSIELVEDSSTHRVTPLTVAAEVTERGVVASADEEPAGLDTTGVPPPPFLSAAESAAEGPQMTSLTPSGEMLSEPVVVAPIELPKEAAADPASPLHHESALIDAPEHTPMPQSFAPGLGQLEEEMMDEEEHEPTSIHASYEEEFDDLEEETLEGTADLGTMIREMSIDEITRPANEEEEAEDEDFEEEDARFSAGAGESEDAGEEAFAGGDKPQSQSAADTEFFANTFREPRSESEIGSERQHNTDQRPRRDNRRDPRRDGRDRNRSRSTGGDSERGRSGHGGGGPRRSMQATNLPAISDLLKPGQEILVQIAKEPIAKKGARITSHIALPGRFLVFMPTVNHTGVSRKIESDGERRRLKEILLSEKGDAAGGFIVRTAAMGASEEELRSDLRFLLNLWADIKQRSESSKSPALIYHDLNLVERILRDQVTDNFSAIWVDTETEYERVLRFLQRFQPQLIRRVKLYTKETPLFEQFGITEEINKALRSKVWLKSGGSIVINQTEALVAIDINTGKFVGKTARLEDTIVKTNLDAIPEIVRQIRLRDLGGIIIIDFIDMDERKNRNKVMAALEEELKLDRAPSKVLQFNDFGLVAITRKRVKQSLERTLSTTCNVCQGTGMTKSPVTICNDIYIEMRKMQKHLDRGDVMLRVHPEVVKQLKSGTSKWLQEMEEMVGKTILVKSDPSLHPEQFDIH